MQREHLPQEGRVVDQSSGLPWSAPAYVTEGGDVEAASTRRVPLEPHEMEPALRAEARASDGSA
jgi:hypothetical protein